jgi:DNA-directed RNA polymerase delta subunit
LPQLSAFLVHILFITESIVTSLVSTQPTPIVDENWNWLTVEKVTKPNSRDDDTGGIEISHASIDHDREVKKDKLNHDSMIYHLRSNSKKKYGNDSGDSDNDNNDDDSDSDYDDNDYDDKRTNKKFKRNQSNANDDFKRIKPSESSSDAASIYQTPNSDNQFNTVYDNDWYAATDNSIDDLGWLLDKGISEQLKGLN